MLIQAFAKFTAWLTPSLAVHIDDFEDRISIVAHVLEVLHCRFRTLVFLIDDGLGLIVVHEDVVADGAGIMCPRQFHTVGRKVA